MARLLQILYSVVAVALIVFLVQATMLVRSSRKAVPSGSVDTLLTQTSKVLSQTSSVLQTAQNTALEEQTQLKAGMRELNKSLADAHDLITHTDVQLNWPGGVLPDTKESLLASVNLQNGVAADLHTNMLLLQPTLKDLSIGAASFAQQMSNPDIPATVANVKLVSMHFAGISANIESTTADVAAFTHRELAPVKGTWNLIKGFLMEFAGPAAEVATAVK